MSDLTPEELRELRIRLNRAACETGIWFGYQQISREMVIIGSSLECPDVLGWMYDWRDLEGAREPSAERPASDLALVAEAVAARAAARAAGDLAGDHDVPVPVPSFRGGG